jgi:hypothetical protein
LAGSLKASRADAATTSMARRAAVRLGHSLRASDFSRSMIATVAVAGSTALSRVRRGPTPRATSDSA